MCGICGKVYFDAQRTITRAELEQMSRTLAHRGPDGEGIWIDGHVGLAHRRLAIIDLRAVAGQPMSNEDGSIWLTFNGEIYNFQELRVELKARGHVFRTSSDTEVIVHAYEEYGRACLSRFRGMFAFALWDARTRTLFLARDRVGKKPLYYYRGHDRFVFGSEIKALLTDPAVPREPDPIALDHYLALQYIPAPLTAFRGVYKLPAAHWLALHDGHIEIGRYWHLRYTPKRPLSMRDATAELQCRLAEAVRLRLVSDVPLGAFLSGGVDSSAVVAHMARAMDSPVRTFSVGFAEAVFDERPFARMVAESYGTAHAELVVEAPVVDILPRLVWHYDEPLGDASAVPSYAIAALTRQHVTVALNGDGGDENFAGYDRYITARLLRHGDVIPLPVRRACAAMLRRLPVDWPQRRSPLGRLVKIAAIMAQTPARRYARLGGHFLPEERQRVYTDAFRAAVAESDPEGVFVNVFARSDTDDWTDTALNADVNLYLADDLLVKMDRATMAHSLEARSPFLDHVLMEYVASLPPSFKLAGFQKKRVLKASLRGLVPGAVLDRPKMGFCAPIMTWFRNGLREMAYDVLLAPRATQRDYFRPQAVAELLDAHCRGEANYGVYLWDLLVLELWHRTFIDGEGLVTTDPPDTQVYPHVIKEHSQQPYSETVWGL
jgi:asparagine synthase (glutamine-hydrolysing)